MITISSSISLKQRRDILQYAKYCAKELGIKKKIKIEIYPKNTNSRGHCGLYSKKSSVYFVIWINSYHQDWFKTRREILGHEIQHAAQFEYKRLTYKGQNLYFLGKRTNSLRYFDRPEEVEARLISDYLEKKWIAKYKEEEHKETVKFLKFCFGIDKLYSVVDKLKKLFRIG